MEDREFVDEQIRALTARLWAQGAVIEFLLGIVLGERTPEAAAVIATYLRKVSQQPPDIRVQTDLAAEFLADVTVKSSEQMEGLLARAMRMGDAP